MRIELLKDHWPFKKGAIIEMNKKEALELIADGTGKSTEDPGPLVPDPQEESEEIITKDDKEKKAAKKKKR